jgi:predicted nucleic acid-binding protein
LIAALSLKPTLLKLARIGYERSSMIRNTGSRFLGWRSEVISALTRRFNEGDLTQIEVDQACDELNQDCAAYLLVDVTSQILEAAVGNARKHSLGGYDAVQLASAIAVRTALLATQGKAIDFTLVSADNALNDAARLEGLQVEDPSVH